MKQNMISFVVAAGALLLTATNCFSYSSYGNAVNSACAPETVFTGDCSLCHSADYSAPNPAKTAYLQGGAALTDFFCLPVGPSCTDNDNDTYSVEGGDCGPVDCDDTNAAINPGSSENCSDNIDNNCNSLVDVQDPAAVGCPVCTDSDGDGFSIEGGNCGTIDCNDNAAAINPSAADIPNNGVDENCDGVDSVDPTVLDGDGDGFTQADGDCNDANAAINPGAVDLPNNGIDENCDGIDSIDTSTLDNDADGFSPANGDCDDSDGAINPDAIENCIDAIDNNCNGLVDAQDPTALNCPVNCTDTDADAYSIEGGNCGPVDCNDSDINVNPGAGEICDDGIDNDCDGSIDEGCDLTCPDLDGDGYQDASCGGTDCNDLDATVNPGSTEVCGNEVDENCNGVSDDVCETCPDGSLLTVRKVSYDRSNRRTLTITGRATVGTTISIVNSDTGETLIEGITVNKRARWKAELTGVRRTLRNITFISSNGCEIEKKIRRKVYVPPQVPTDDDDDEHDDEHED